MAGHLEIATARVPGGVELQLLRSGDDFMIALGDNELMSTDICASEQALALMTCERLSQRPEPPHLLVGGYGMGFTLRAALGALDGDARITVAEIMPEIIEWARGPMRQLTAGCLDDARVTVVIDDVGRLIRSASQRYDAIMLDVDNGPEGLTRRQNDNLYSSAGLRAASDALKPGGILAVWSADGDPVFTRALRDAGFAVHEVSAQAQSDDDSMSHHIWLAQNQ